MIKLIGFVIMLCVLLMIWIRLVLITETIQEKTINSCYECHSINPHKHGKKQLPIPNKEKSIYIRF